MGLFCQKFKDGHDGGAASSRGDSAALLSAALDLAMAEGEVFYGHVMDMLARVSNYSPRDWEAYKADMLRDSDHSRKVQDLNTHLAKAGCADIRIPKEMQNSPIRMDDLALTVASELVHRGAWEAVWSDNLDMAELLRRASIRGKEVS
jgi:acetyl esterase/lipase